MINRVEFKIEKGKSRLLNFLPQIQFLGDSEKEAVGFLPESAFRDAIIRGRLFAITAFENDMPEIAGYLLHSGVFPHAKIQQIVVTPKYRKSGVAKTLMNTLVSDLERLGFMTIKADVAADLSAPLLFYPRNGFEPVLSRPGGQARGRTIIVHVRQLDTESLFSFASRNVDNISDLGIRRRSAGDDPFFAFDLNIYFDLVRDRDKSENARQLFGAALAHHIRLAVADEFVKELQRTSNNVGADPILQMALRLPRLPQPDLSELSVLADKMHELVFVKPGASTAGSKTALSDAQHLAHAALSRASAFVTRDGAILAARDDLLLKFGIDIATLDELVSLLPKDETTATVAVVQGDGFQFLDLTEPDLDLYTSSARIEGNVVADFRPTPRMEAITHLKAIRENGSIVAIGAIRMTRGIEANARLLVHVRPEHPDCEMFADYMLDTLTRLACADLPTAVELLHIPGQTALHTIARSRGFLRNAVGGNYSKLAFGRPLSSENWASSVQEVRRRTGLALPTEMPNARTSDAGISVKNTQGESVRIGLQTLEDILSPAILVWPGRQGVLVPIGRAFADDLLGSSLQTRFAFVANRDAAFLSRRSYVNSPKSAGLMRPESPILFYESVRTGGRGAVVAVGRIVDAVVVGKGDVTSSRRKRLVVDDVDDFSNSPDVLLTTFDNLFVMPKPVSITELKKIGAMGKANLVAPVSLSSEQITRIITQGWSGGRL